MERQTSGQEPPLSRKRSYGRWLLALGSLISSGSVIAIVNKAFDGIVGNFASDIFNRLLAWLSSKITVNMLLWIVASIAVFISIAVYFYMHHHSTQLKAGLDDARTELTRTQETFRSSQDELTKSKDNLQAVEGALETANTRLEQKNQALQFDDFLLDNLDNLLDNLDALKSTSLCSEKGMQDLLSRGLHKITEAQIFNNISLRAAIFVPDNSGEYLHMGAHYQMPNDSVSRTICYIGNDRNKEDERGAAGAVYLTQKLRVVHFAHENDTKSDYPAYKNFATGRGKLPYQSLIQVPIFEITANSSSEDKKYCYGILSLDSTNKSIFDSPAAQSLLLFASKRLAAVLQIYQHLSQTRNTTVAP